MIVFISGGVRSGKTNVAEHYAQQLASKWDYAHYIATAHITDEEMRQRVFRHQEERNRQLLKWKTREIPNDLHRFTDNFNKNDIVLLDCLTNLLANELFSDDGWKNQQVCFEKTMRIYQSIEKLAKKCKGFIIVSNEIFSSGVPEDIGTYHYMKMLGFLHQQIVVLADKAIFVRCGIPLVKKGSAS